MLEIYNERYSDFNSMIERYEREMREAYGLVQMSATNDKQQKNNSGTSVNESQNSSEKILEEKAENQEAPQEGGTGTPAAEPENETFEQSVPLPPLPAVFSEAVPDMAETEMNHNQTLPENVPPEFSQPESALQQEEIDEIGRQDGYVLSPPEINGENEEVSNEDGNTDRSHVQSDSGYIVVTTNSGRDAIPINGVTVVIDRLDESDPAGRQELIYVQQTNQSGRTEPVKVKTVSRTLSQSPGDMGPFMTYYISVRHPGYEPVINRPVDVFGGETSILELELIPLPEDLSGGGDNG